MAPRRTTGKAQQTTAAPDLGEKAALDKAAEALRNSSGDALIAAERCITAWIMERSVQAAKERQSSEKYILTLGDSRIESVAAACLGPIATALMETKLDFSYPFFNLGKDEVVKLFTIVYCAMRDNMMDQAERPSFSDQPFDDEIPF